METFNEDPKPGRLVLPLVLIGMIATTYTFINRVSSNNNLEIEPMVDEISAHEIGIRAALLERLSSVEGATASSENFRSLIEPDLRDAANAILGEQKVFPGIDSVLFTEFLMQ